MKKHIVFCFILLIITMLSVCKAEVTFPYNESDDGSIFITDAEGTEEYYLPDRGEWTLWDNPRTTNDGKPFVILPGERVTIVSIQGWASFANCG